MKPHFSHLDSWVKTAMAVLCMLFFMVPGFSNVRLPGVLTNNMVLQRNKEIKIWGWADKGEKVSVSFNNKTLSVNADKSGKWLLVFPPMKEGGPYSMGIKGENSITLENILIGDVWVCSGQSNMEWSVKNSNNSEKEIANADYPTIRLLTVPKNLQYSPVDNVTGLEWEVCSPESVGNFSAVGYFFGRDLFNEVNIPIGLINTSWGGTNVEAWTSGDFISRVEEFKNKVEVSDPITPEELEAARIKKMENIFSQFGLDPKKPENTETWNKPGIDLTWWQDIETPGLWESTKIGELDGVVWFRKEVNIPENLTGKEWTLMLGKIDDNDKTFINGILVGETNKYDDLREYNLKAGTFTPGINLISVRVEDTGGGGGFWGVKEDMKLVCPGTEISLAGIWKCRLSLESINININVGNPNNIPSCLYNGMIYPLLNLPVTGAIWYQGESNASRAYQYRTLFPLMIESWREKWNQPDLHFFFVQLANYMKPDDIPVESDWAELREAQSMTLSLPYTGMAVTIDIGEEKDIHPRNKQDVGYRLALHALKSVYGKPVVTNGLVYKSMRVEGERAFLSFDLQGSNLVVNDKYGYIKGFSIAGADKKFYWARARLRDNQIIVSSDKVSMPVAVRYAWSNNPGDANLFNTEGLPASPFRTDDWPGITFNVK
jgi:sialate O-acetylesterase